MTHGEEVRVGIAWDFLDSGNTVGALDIVRQARADGFGSPELDLLQGKAMRLDGVVSEAESLLDRAASKMPRDGRASAELCVLFAEEGRIEEAVARCERARRLDDSDARSRTNLAFLLMSMERQDEALEPAQEAVHIDGTVAKYRNNLGLAQAANGRVEMAFRTLQSTMEKSEAAYTVGLSVERFDGFDKARSWYERALNVNPNHMGAKVKLRPPEDGADEAPVEDP